MTFREYLRYNSKAIVYSLKITGAIFTAMILFFIVPSSAFNDLPLRLLIIFIISVLSGNILSFIVCCLKLNSTFQQTKRNYKLFDSISSEIIEEFFLQIKPKIDISKNNFLEIHIVGKLEKTPLVIEVSDQKEIWITIINKLVSCKRNIN
jgi:ABC-type enterochelin transport system permease subunit